MRILLAVLVVESVIGAASAALKPIETDIHPELSGKAEHQVAAVHSPLAARAFESVGIASRPRRSS